MEHRHYPKLGGDLKYGCYRLASGSGGLGAVIILYRGPKEEAEVGMSFAPNLKMDAAGFRRLADEILRDLHSCDLKNANKACLMLSEATSAECVIIFLITKNGSVQVGVSQPKSAEFVAGYALKIADDFNAMN